MERGEEEAKAKGREEEEGEGLARCTQRKKIKSQRL